ncbi:MAG: sporulation protein YabP [Oscillospiraceae bacterium]
MPEDIKIKTTQNVIMENRAKLMITGVRDVDSFDDQTVVMMTEMGELTIKGTNLRINKFIVETGEIAIDGEVIALVYTNDKSNSSGSIFSKLFK